MTIRARVVGDMESIGVIGGVASVRSARAELEAAGYRVTEEHYWHPTDTASLFGERSVPLTPLPAGNPAPSGSGPGPASDRASP
jgi:hypothetical protein